MTSFYYYGHLLPNNDLFVGRTNELRKLYELAKGPTGQYAIILGAPFSGKTSLIYQMSGSLPADIDFMRVNLRIIGQRNAHQLYSYIASRFLSRVRGTTPLNLSQVTDGFEFCNFLRGLDLMHPTIVVLDELTELPEAVLSDLAKFLYLINDERSEKGNETYKNLVFVLAGGIELYRPVAQPFISPLYRVSERIRLPDLSKKESNSLLAIGFERAGVKPDTIVAEEVYKIINDWTQGYPYLTQRLGDITVDYWIKEGKPPNLDFFQKKAIPFIIEDEGRHLKRMQTQVASEGLSPMLSKIMESPGKLEFNRAEDEIARLELIGLICNDDGYCRIRNRIYERAFSSQLPVSDRGKVTRPVSNISSELIEQIRKGNVVLFCGAGISVSENGIPSSKQLIDALAKSIGLDDVGNSELPEVAQVYEAVMGRHSLIATISSRIEDAGHAPLRPHQLIATLSFQRIITTNWDILLEEALRQAGKPMDRIVRDEDMAYTDEKKVTLIKLHGTVDQKDTIVVTGEDYYDVFARLPETANLVRSYFATKTLLLLGYDLADEEFKRLYHEVMRHLGKHKRRTYAVQFNPKSITVKHWQQKNVEVIAADTTAFLEALLKELDAHQSQSTSHAVGILPTPAQPSVIPLPSSATLPITSSIHDSSGLNLKQGLEIMKNLLRDGEAEVLLDFSNLESRLLANIQDEHYYGSTEIVRSERARIMHELNRVAIDRIQRTFNELCKSQR